MAGGWGGWRGGGRKPRWKKISSFASCSPPASSAEKKKENKKECTKKSRTQIISPVNLAGDIMNLLSLVLIKTRFEKSLCFTMDSFSRVRDGIVTHSAKCLEPQ